MQKVLFMGMGKTAVGWYRCYLPAIFLGADWIGVAGQPPHLQFVTGIVKGKTELAPFESYDVIVIQQPRGPRWLKLIRDMQERGIKVVYEVDDYLHGIRKMKDHDYASYFDKPALRQLELCMGACDAMICSTEYIAKRYRAFNRNIHVCPNGVDVGRYNLTLPDRASVNIGWAGATGHLESALPWMREVGGVLSYMPETCFVSIGQNFASMFSEAFGPRTISIPFTLIDTYPAAMTLFDLALAPAGKSNFFRGKSDLRWVECGALGIPLIADPDVYPNIRHGVTGFHAHTPREAGELMRELVADHDLRTRVGREAQAEVRATRDMRVTSRAWTRVLGEVLEG